MLAIHTRTTLSTRKIIFNRGKRPFWFTKAIKKRGITTESLLIDGDTSAPIKPAMAARKKKAVRRSNKRRVK